MKNWRSFSLKSLLIITLLSCIFISWRVNQYNYGTVDDWIDSVLEKHEQQNPTVGQAGGEAVLMPCQADISEEEQIRLLMNATRWLPTSSRRNCVLKIIAEQFPAKSHDLFVQLIQDTQDEDLKRNCILLASIFRDESDIDLFKKFLDDEQALVRSAAVDAISIVHSPAFPMPAGFDYTQSDCVAAFDCEPRIYLVPIINTLVDGSLKYSKRQNWNVYRAECSVIRWRDKSDRKLDSSIIEKIKRMLLEDPDEGVRSAAARAARKWTPENYSLRIAEWGVWINDGNNLTLAQSVIDEIPLFVHRVGNDMQSIESDRKNSMIVITKPIIHVTVDTPMVIDLAVRISAGRPWFGFPLPDDFSVEGNANFGSSLTLPDVPKELDFEQLSDIRSGYPWLKPGHPRHYATNFTEVGFRWQTLFVSPKKLDWMTLESVSDSKYQWWNRLREVPSGWVSNRGESERFLYYDGPTENPSPVKIILENEQLIVIIPPGAVDYSRSNDRTLLFINVVGENITGKRISHSFGKSPTPQRFSIKELPIKGQAVENELLETLIKFGLNDEEAKGLIDCWRQQFFETDGQRVLTIFNTEEYDRLCPISISPTPTEISRVGIVLSELGKREE